MKKKLLNWSLMAVMLCGAGLSLTACSDDDEVENKESGGSSSNPLDSDEARTAFRWLCALTDEETLEDGWKTKTYEVTAGQPSEQNDLVRIIIVSDLDEAKADFSSLADIEVSKLGTRQTVNGGAAGTMTWTPSAEGAHNLAEVAVSSRILPKLQKIVYCTAEQTGQNGLLWDSMKGTAYYRLGDVVRDPDGYYWVCVRPSFAPDKGDSHWINIFNASDAGRVLGSKKSIPREYIYDKYNHMEKYDGKTILLPQKLPYDRKMIHHLSNLIWAIGKLDAYKEACLRDAKAGICGFDYKYHGEKFFRALTSYWAERVPGEYFTICEALTGCTIDDFSDFGEIGFFYQGHSWWFGNTATMWRYKSKGYVGRYGDTGSESGDKESIDVVTQGFDINRYAYDAAADTTAKGGPTPYYKPRRGKTSRNWVIRYKSGKQLCTDGRYDPYRKLTGCTDIYRYNEKENIECGENVAQETEDSQKSFAGVAHYKIGEMYRDQRGCQWFVIESAGIEYNRVDPNSQYSYLISFDGIETGLSNGYASNLPSRDMAIKSSLWLDALYGMIAAKSDNTIQTSISPFVRAASNIIFSGNIDLRKLGIVTMPLSGAGADEATHQWCVAYKTEDGQQHLMRVINECENVTSRRMPRYYFWDHYRDTTELKTDNGGIIYRFTNRPILLSDINNAELVKSYGTKDNYSRQPLVTSKNVTRQPRTTTDARSLDIRNYLFTNNSFASDARSMWNEPVLFYRVTKVSDKGENDYSQTTVDGQTLTLDDAPDWSDETEDDELWLYSSREGLERMWGGTLEQSLRDVYVDGVHYTVPTWKNIK